MSVPLYQAEVEFFRKPARPVRPRSGIVTSARERSTVVHEVAGGDVADLSRAARRILSGVLAGWNELSAELREAGVTAR